MIADAVFNFFRLLFGILPRRWALGFGAYVGMLSYVVSRKRRRIARANLAQALAPEKSYGEISRFARESFRRVGMRFVEFCRIGKYAKHLDRPSLAVRGESRVKAGLSQGKGAVYLSSHLGNGELADAMIRALGYPCLEVVSERMKKWFDKALVGTRMRGSFVSLESEKDKSRLVALLRNNEGVIITLDSSPGHRHAEIPFLGKVTSVSTLAAELALETGACVIPTLLLMDAHYNYHLVFGQPLNLTKTGQPDADAVANTSAFCKIVVRYVTRYTAHWPWMLRTSRAPENARLRKPFREVQRLLVKMPNWLGDVVMSLPAVESLRGLFPHAKIACLIKEGLADAVRNFNALDFTIAYEHGSGIQAVWKRLRTIRNVRRNFFDAVVLLTNSFESALWMYLSGIPLRVGYRTAGRGFLLTHSVRRNPSPGHQIQYYLDLVAALGEAGEPSAPSVRISPRDREWADDFIRSMGVSSKETLVGLCPGAAYGAAKMWLGGRFIQVSRRICEHSSARFLVFGGKSDSEACSTVADGIGEMAINLCGKTTLRELAALMERCALVISNDSGPLHLAAAAGTPVIGIFGSTDPTRTAPPQNCTVIKKSVPCSPCFKRECPTDFQCMTSISAEEVYQEAAQILSGRSVNKSGESEVSEEG